MSRNGTLLPIPADGPLAAAIGFQLSAWNMGAYSTQPFPRSAWLGEVERQLLKWYPLSSSADRKLTARHYAPFPLRDGPNVP